MANDPTVIHGMCRASLGTFCVIMDPKYQIVKHVEIFLQAAHKVESGEWDRLWVSVPPRHSKSETFSVNFPAWYMGLHPDHYLIMATYSDKLSQKNGSRVRERMTDPLFQEIFPDCRLSKATMAKDHFRTTAGGECLFTTVRGQLTGFGSNLMILDDLFKDAKEAMSPTIRDNVIEFYRSAASTRLMPDGRIVLIGTRWHEGDLHGWLLDPAEQEEVDNWRVLSFPAIAEKDEGWRKEGDALWPEMWPIEKLLRKKHKTGMSDWNWASMYQCRPSSIEGREIKREWWKYYSWDPHLAARRNLNAFPPTQPYFIYQSWDTASKTEQHHDYSVCTTWLVTSSGYFILDMWRDKVIAPDLFERAKQLAAYWGAQFILVEDSSVAHAFVQMMQTNTQLPIIPIHPKGDKAARMRGVSGYIQAGRVFLPVSASWLGDFLDELTSFPTSGHDDITDTVSQLLHYVTLEQDTEQKFNEMEEADEPIILWDR